MKVRVKAMNGFKASYMRRNLLKGSYSKRDRRSEQCLTEPRGMKVGAK